MARAMIATIEPKLWTISLWPKAQTKQENNEKQKKIH